MKNYLSFGGGVNSVAMMLLLLDEGVEFEAVYVWMPDWPETHDYLMMLEDKGYPITVLFPWDRRKSWPMGLPPDPDKYYSNLYEFCWDRHIFPYRQNRWCSVDFKQRTLKRYYQGPAFINIGYDIGEERRAKITSDGDFEYRFPLIEHEIDRKGCLEIIKGHGLVPPPKSGCFFCPEQNRPAWRHLRRKHPDLWCASVQLEKRAVSKAIEMGHSVFYLADNHKPLSVIVNERDSYLFDELAYPPCQCGL